MSTELWAVIFSAVALGGGGLGWLLRHSSRITAAETWI